MPPLEHDRSNVELASVADQFIDFCESQYIDKDGEPVRYTDATIDEQIRLQPFLAHSFVYAKAARVPEHLKRVWHERLPVESVATQLAVILDKHGTHLDALRDPERAGQTKRLSYLINQRQYAWKYGNKFPEVFAADRLARELFEAGQENMTDSVELLIAAQAAVIRLLPDSEKLVPNQPGYYPDIR
jgi:hypothetical protein